jgi:hypothetical protein
LLLKSVPAVMFTIILLLSFTAGFEKAPVTPNAVTVTTTVTTTSIETVTETATTNQSIRLDVHVDNQFGLWDNGALVEVFYEIPYTTPLQYTLVANGTTTNGVYVAAGLSIDSTYNVYAYTANGGQSNQTVTVGTNDLIVTFLLASPPPPTLSLQDVTITPNTETAGAPFSVSAEVVNTSNSTAYNTVLTITPPAQFSLLSTGSVIPFGVLTPGASKPLNLLMSVSTTSAAPGYALGYLLNFTDNTGTPYSTAGTVSLPSPPLPVLVIQNVALNPLVIQPGSTFSLTVLVANTSNSTAFNAVLTVTPPADYSLLNAGSVIPVGTLQPGATKAVTLQLIVSSGVSIASNTISYVLSYTDYFLNKATTAGSVFVPVSGNPVSPKLIITTATFSSSAIHPSDNFTVPIVIENVGTVSANEVVLSVNATSPLVISGSAGDYRLGVIAANGTISVKLGFSSPPSSVLGAYPITLTLAYQDQFGTIYSSSQVLVATLVGQPTLVLNTFEFRNTPLTPGLQTFLNAQLLNVGGDSALNVKVTFQNAPVYLADTTIFLGSIQSGGTGNATAYLQIPSNTTVGSFMFNVVVSYTDTAGKQYQVIDPYTVTVAPFSPPQVSITNTLLSPEVLTPGTQGTMTIYLRNNGATPANDLTLRLVNGSKFFSSDYFGLGTLDQATSGTTTVGVNVASSLLGGNYLVQIVANYTDNNGASYNFTLPLELTIYSSSSILSLKDAGIALAVGIVGVVVYLGIPYTRTRR